MKACGKAECFVFDNRVAVNHQLAKGNTINATAAGTITAADKESEFYLGAWPARAVTTNKPPSNASVFPSAKDKCNWPNPAIYPM